MHITPRRLFHFLYWSRMAKAAHDNSWKYRDPSVPLPHNFTEDWRMGYVASCQRISANASRQARKVLQIDKE